MNLPARSFFTTPRVIVGSGAINKVGTALRDLGVAAGRVLLVIDPTLVQFGVAGLAQQHLGSAGLDVALFSEIPAEPTEEIADAVTAAIRHVRPAAVVGIGGGSALDMGKLAAVMATNRGEAVEYFSGRAFDASPLPLALVPTTAGTGSESSPNAVISRKGRKVVIGSPLLMPRAAILDPQLTLTLPPNVTAWTGMDALSHCAEGLLSASASPLTNAVAVRGVQIIRKYLPVAYAEGRDLVAREHMQIGAYLGGLALNAGMVLGHSIAYTLAHRLRLAHGLSCALALAPCVAYNASAAPAQIELLAQGLGVAGEPVAVVDDIQRLASAVGIPRAWRDLGLAHEDLPAMVEECMARYPRPNNPKPLEREPLKRLYEAAWTGASPLQ